MGSQTLDIGGIQPGSNSAGGSNAEGTPSWRSGASPSPTPRTAALTPNTPLPVPNNAIPRSLTERESQLVKHLSRLQFFLATAPTRWTGNDDVISSTAVAVSARHPNLNRFPLLNGEYVSCVFWNGLYHITGTDIVRALVFRFEAFSRPVQNMKKFEEGVFSDLRNLKPGTDACLEEPKSPFLDLLFRNACIRTQKKVFYWFSVPHDRLFLDALERDLKREKANTEPTTAVLGEPARSFRYDPTRGLYEQFAGKQPGLEPSEEVGSPESVQLALGESDSAHTFGSPAPMSSTGEPAEDDGDHGQSHPPAAEEERSAGGGDSSHTETATSALFSRSLLKGSPSYKQRRKKASRGKRQRSRASTAGTQHESVNEDSGSDNDAVHMPSYSTPFITATTGRPNDCIDSDLHRVAIDKFPHEQSRSASTLSSQVGILQPWPQLFNEGLVNSGERGSEDASSNLALAMKLDNNLHRVGGSTPPASQQPPIGKGFSCPLLSCGRLFKRLEHLKRHVRTHTQERPYECNRCSKRFSRSDNLTQHVKTHEKADRGERMKTEASESTEDEVVRYLEAEVDAMAAREMRGFGGAADGSGGSNSYPIRQGLNASHLSRPFQPQLQPYTSPLNIGIAPSFGLPHASGWSGSIEQPWAGVRDGINTPPADLLRSNLLKRHRSMTPNFAPPRSVISPAMGTRYHPYALPPLGAISHIAAHGHRSSSVDSSPNPPRMTAAPTNELLPEYTNPHTKPNDIIHRQHAIRNFSFQPLGSAAPASIFPALAVGNAMRDNMGEIEASADAVAEASGFAEWASGSF